MPTVNLLFNESVIIEDIDLRLKVDHVEDNHETFYRCSLGPVLNLEIELDHNGTWRDRWQENHAVAKIIGGIIESKLM